MKLLGSALILGSILIFLFGPLWSLPLGVHRGFYPVHSGFVEDNGPYGTILVVQRYGPSLVLMVLGFIAGFILLVFSKPLSDDLARIRQMTPRESARLLDAAASTVGFYSLALNLVWCAAEIYYNRDDHYWSFQRGYVYPGVATLLFYATIVGIICLIFFRFARRSRVRWLLLCTGLAPLAFWIFIFFFYSFFY